MYKIREKPLLYTLAFIQFTHVMDFMIMMPLSTHFTDEFGITNAAFGLLVASYNISAGIFAAAGAFFIDRFDRRKVMLLCYTAFIIGTLACGFAPTFGFLLAARIFTGMFGGIIISTMLSIVADAIPYERRASAMAIMYMGFSGAAILGVPGGSFIAAHSSWHIPFIVIAVMGIPILFAAMRFIPPMAAHVEEAKKRNPFRQFAEIVSSRNRLLGLLLMGLLMLGHFSIIPYIPNFMVHNLGMEEQYVGFIYLAGGVASVFSMRVIGRLSDKHGSLKVFAVLSLCALFPILTITHLPVAGLIVILLLAATLFVFGGNRGVPANTLISATALPHQRGGFMSLTSAVQQLGAGLASFFAGLLITEGPNHTVLQYDHVGYLAAAASILAVPVAMMIKPVAKLPAEE
ncbi:MAG TPA: MFS transporter [Bacteroidia bacterium]|nr:MFS transporter [Bacteroidia bacterium]